MYNITEVLEFLNFSEPGKIDRICDAIGGVGEDSRGFATPPVRSNFFYFFCGFKGSLCNSLICKQFS